MVTEHSEIAGNGVDGLTDIDVDLWLSVLEAPGTAPLIGRVRGLAAAPSTLAISGPRGVGKRALASLVHGWSERPGELSVVECASLVARGALSHERADLVVDRWFRAAAGGTLVLVDPGFLAQELQLAVAARLPSVHGASLDRWSEPPAAAAGPRTEARVILVLEAGGLDWLELDLRHRVAQHTELPPLEAHGADVVVVVRTLLDVLAARDGAGPRRVTGEGLEYLQRCSWPGQVAGLMRTVMAARLATQCQAPGGAEAEIDRAALAAAHARGVLRPAAIVVDAALDASYRDAKETIIEQFEGLFFARVLERTHGNVSEAARQTGLDRSNFRRALRRARERAGSAHPERRSSPGDSVPGAATMGGGPGSVAADTAADSSRRYDSGTHHIESGVRWPAADGSGRSGANGRGPSSSRPEALESGEVARPGVASVRHEIPPPARLDGTHTRR